MKTLKNIHVLQSAIFDSEKTYDIDLIVKTLSEVGCKNFRIDNNFGWSNQPKVVIFDIPYEETAFLPDNDRIFTKGKKALQKAFNTPWIILGKIDWKLMNVEYYNFVPDLKIVVIDNSKSYSAKVIKKTGHILSYFLCDFNSVKNGQHKNRYRLDFLYNRVEKYDNFYNEDTMSEEEVANGQDELTAFESVLKMKQQDEDGLVYIKDYTGNNKVLSCSDFTVVCDIEMSESQLEELKEDEFTFETYNDVLFSVLDLLIGNPVEISEHSIVVMITDISGIIVKNCYFGNVAEAVKFWKENSEKYPECLVYCYKRTNDLKRLTILDLNNVHEFGVFVYDHEDVCVQDSHFNNSDDAVVFAKEFNSEHPEFDIEVWQKDNKDLFGNSGEPIWKTY